MEFFSNSRFHQKLRILFGEFVGIVFPLVLFWAVAASHVLFIVWSATLIMRIVSTCYSNALWRNRFGKWLTCWLRLLPHCISRMTWQRLFSNCFNVWMCPNVKILLPSYEVFGRVWTRDFGNMWKKIKIRLYIGLLAFLKIKSWPYCVFQR
jgi:hypothetical protein